MRDVASQRTKRAVRAGMSVTAATAALLFTVPGPAMALPFTYQQPAQPDTASEALAQYQALTQQVSQVNEQLLAAKTDLDAKNAVLAQANTDLAAANAAKKQAAADEETYRGQVDELTSASYQGARFNKLSALLTGSSAEDFLARASALGVIAQDNNEALSKLSAAVNQAAEAESKAATAQKTAAEASAQAQALTDQISKTKTDLDAQVAQVEETYEQLSGADQEALRTGDEVGAYLAPAGTGGAAANAAMSQRGKMYSWGAAGPNTYDCSGLTMWAYKQVGVSLPHSSRAQYGYGKSVSVNELQAGDLLFYGSSAGSIHHVAMAIGGGKLVHASTTGTPVKVDDAPYGAGKDFLGAKRIAG
jgi:cell wall-associated NlpC family hydrolase